MSKELKKYIEEQNLKQENFKTFLSNYKDELDNMNLHPSEKNKLIDKFVKENTKYINHTVKFDNFIIDIRKPSFIYFIMFFIFSIIGIIYTLRKIIDLIFS